MDIKQKLALRKLIRNLEAIRGRHTELVSVYIPVGYDIIKIIQHLQQEQGTASNIKDAKTRNNVIDSLERMIRHLRLYKRNPPNGLAVFSGNVSNHPSKITIEVWSIEPPEPLNFRLYRCDQTFMLEPLKEMMEHKETYGLIVLDRRDASIGLLKGNSIKEIASTASNVPGKAKTGGQCVHPDTLVQSIDGRIIEIKHTHNPYVLKSVNFNNLTIEDSPITDKWEAEKDIAYDIITKSPQLRITSSKDHMFFVATEKGIIEKASEELKEGDTLIMPERIIFKGRSQKLNPKEYYNSFLINKKGRELLTRKRLAKNLFQKKLAQSFCMTQTAISKLETGERRAGRLFLVKLCLQLGINFKKFLNTYAEPYKHKNVNLPETLDSNFAQFLGYLTGDGCIEEDRITFFEQRKEVALELKKRFDKYLNINSSYKYRKSKNYHQLRFTSRPLVRLIREKFSETKKKPCPEIPELVLKSQNKIVAAFLKGLFDAEGYTNDARRGVSISINNKKLSQQIQLVLLRFSILSSLYEYDNRANKYSDKPRFTVDITEKKSIELFQKNIGFTAKDKVEKLKILINKKTDKSETRQILTHGNEVRRIIEKAGYNLQMFPKVSGFFRDRRMMGKQTFKNSILDRVKDKWLYKKLKEIYNVPLLPVKILRIRRIEGKTRMVDLSVKNQSFIANGIIVHNSARRFERIRLEMKKEFFKRVGELANQTFLTMKDLKGILIGGPVPTKDEFVDGDYLNNELKKKIIAMQDLGYTGDFGLKELVDKSNEVLAKEEVTKEKKVVNEFFELLRKEPGKVAYGKKEVMEALEIGAIEKLLISENLPEEELEQLQERGEKSGAEVHIISIETMEGGQIKDLGGYAAILRYALK